MKSPPALMHAITPNNQDVEEVQSVLSLCMTTVTRQCVRSNSTMESDPNFERQYDKINCMVTQHTRLTTDARIRCKYCQISFLRLT